MKSFKNDAERIKWYREYRDKHREKIREYSRRQKREWRALNKAQCNFPEKQSARMILNLAIKQGIIKRGSCMICHKVNAHGHHDDYSKPLKVLWLCPLHHSMRHNPRSQTNHPQ